ncbi:MAG: hypothetical protein WC627_06095 [Legionella sp.]|jgi:hypothetical protein
MLNFLDRLISFVLDLLDITLAFIISMTLFFISSPFLEAYRALRLLIRINLLVLDFVRERFESIIEDLLYSYSTNWSFVMLGLLSLPALSFTILLCSLTTIITAPNTLLLRPIFYFAKGFYLSYVEYGNYSGFEAYWNEVFKAKPNRTSSLLVSDQQDQSEIQNVQLERYAAEQFFNYIRLEPEENVIKKLNPSSITLSRDHYLLTAELNMADKLIAEYESLKKNELALDIKQGFECFKNKRMRYTELINLLNQARDVIENKQVGEEVLDELFMMPLKEPILLTMQYLDKDCQWKTVDTLSHIIDYDTMVQTILTNQKHPLTRKYLFSASIHKNKADSNLYPTRHGWYKLTKNFCYAPELEELTSEVRKGLKQFHKCFVLSKLNIPSWLSIFNQNKPELDRTSVKEQCFPPMKWSNRFAVF